MEKSQIKQILLPAIAGASLLGLILYLVLGPNREEPKPASASPTPPQGTAGPTPASQKAKDNSSEGMAREYPADTDEGYTLLAGGLKSKDIKIGEGEEVPSGASVTCHYAGWQTNGSMFDSTYLRGGSPTEFSLNGVIAGWTKGIPGMKPGGIRRLIIPPEMAYGQGGGGRPGGILVFEIKLMQWR